MQSLSALLCCVMRATTSLRKSTTRCTSSTLSAPASRCSSRTTTKCEMISLNSCNAMPTHGSNSHSAELPLSSSRCFRNISQLHNHSSPLRLLIENGISRLTVWANPSNEAKRGSDTHDLLERNMLESSWPGVVRTVWEVDPSIVVYLTERFKSPAAYAEVQNLVRSNTSKVVDTPEALRFLIVDHFHTADTHLHENSAQIERAIYIAILSFNTYKPPFTVNLKSRRLSELRVIEHTRTYCYIGKKNIEGAC
ncbi:hypothetical protein EDB19DRAFT_687694 [Suillus lakei]|nr:hypothetical protein EDB19DRAFT_687694 [Suillus lakei]